jgi:hypothetical protein
MSTLLLACDVMREEILRIPAPPTMQQEFLPIGLHARPLKLQAAIADLLAKPRGFERIVLGFGLCGNALDGVCSPHAPLVVPRVHDCIPLLTGCPASDNSAAQEKGIFYLSGGWMEGERTLFLEHQRVVRCYGEKRALRVLQTMLSGYSGFVFMRTDHPRGEEREEDAHALADLLQLPLRTVEARPGRLQRLVNGPWNTPEFIQVPAGEPITAAAFQPCHASADS